MSASRQPQQLATSDNYVTGDVPKYCAGSAAAFMLIPARLEQGQITSMLEQITQGTDVTTSLV